MSLKSLAIRGAIGAALMIGPIIGCKDDYYDYPYGVGGGFGGGTSSGAVYRPDASSELCDNVSEGTDCYRSFDDARCEKGEHPNGNCNPHLGCNDDSVWEWLPPPRAVCAPTSACPAAYTESAPDDLCQRPDAISLLCEYDEGTCGCAPVRRPATDDDAGEDADADADAGADADASDADAGATDAGSRAYEWRCVHPDRDAGCPRRRPREGFACVRPMTCDYGDCVFEDGYRMDCSNRIWVRDPSRSEQCDQ